MLLSTNASFGEASFCTLWCDLGNRLGRDQSGPYVPEQLVFFFTDV